VRERNALEEQERNCTEKKQLRLPWTRDISSCDCATVALYQGMNGKKTSADMAVDGLWGGRSERCFVDVRVFNPFAPSNSSTSISSTFKKHENIKLPHDFRLQWGKREKMKGGGGIQTHNQKQVINMDINNIQYNSHL